MSHNSEDEIPFGHFTCNMCEGTGRDLSDSKLLCVICKGKGYYSPQDIDDYHRLNPEICGFACGEQHHTPSEEPTLSLEGIAEFMSKLEK